MTDQPHIRRVTSVSDPAFAQVTDLWRETWYPACAPDLHARYRETLLFGPWGRSHAAIHVLTVGEQVESCLVVFGLQATVRSQACAVAGTALVATHPRARRRGLARRLLDSVHVSLVREGFGLGLLFSDIAPAYYVPLGYRTWPLQRFEVETPEKCSSPFALRDVDEAQDVPLLVDLHEAFRTQWDFSIARDETYWRHLLSRDRMRSELLEPAAAGARGRHLLFEGGRPVAHGAFTSLPDRLVLIDLAWEPDRPAAARALIESLCRRHGRSRFVVTTTEPMIHRLGLVPRASEPVEKMMVASLHPGTVDVAALDPTSHPLLGTDWF